MNASPCDRTFFVSFRASLTRVFFCCRCVDDILVAFLSALPVVSSLPRKPGSATRF